MRAHVCVYVCLSVCPQLTGIVLRAAKRMQVNVMVEKIDGFR